MYYLSVYFGIVLLVHFVADFMLQSHWQAQNKSKRNDALFGHVAVWTACLTAAAVLWFGFTFGAKGVVVGMVFGLGNGVLHFVTDWSTSRWSASYFKEALPLTYNNDPRASQHWHDFFVVIGFDQYVHQLTLGITFILALIYCGVRV